MDSENNIKSYMRIKPEEIVQHPKCKKCLGEITTKLQVKCLKCDLFYHGYCIKNYTNEMKNCI